MSHKCLRCGNIYQDYDSSIVRGCSCGSAFFLFLRSPQDAQQINDIKRELEEKDINLEKELVKKIKEKKKVKLKKPAKEKIVKRKFKEIEFGIETVKMPKEGVYEINLEALMKKRPLIVLEKGRVYFVSLPTIFEKVRKRG